MTGRGSIRHNNRSFSAANVDRSRSEQNITFCNDDLKQVYHELFDEALAAYNAKKKKTRDKIPDYYEHIRQSKQEKLFHEAIFQIGNMEDCGCGSPGGERAAAAIRGAAAEQKVQELKEENQRLQQKIPSTKEKLKEAQERQRLENQNRKLLVQVECLEQELEQERSFSDRLLDGVSAVMDFLDRHLPEKFRPLVERARELLPVPEVQQPEQEQERGHTWGGMEL